MTIFYTPGWSVVTLTGGSEPEKVQGAFVEANLFSMLGVAAAPSVPVPGCPILGATQIKLGLARREGTRVFGERQMDGREKGPSWCFVPTGAG